MEVVHVRATTLSYRYTPEETWSWPGGTYRGWTSVFVRVADKDGHAGVGEIGDGLSIPEVMPALVDRLGRVLVGRELHLSDVVPTIHASTPGWADGGLAASVVSALETAAVDLLARQSGMPAYRLLGAASPQVEVYASGGLSATRDGLRHELASWRPRGHRAGKIRLGHGADEDLARMEVAREVLGEDFTILVDFGASYLPDPPSIHEIADRINALSALEPGWIEDPLPPRDLAGHAELRRETAVPIAGGETLRTPDGVNRLLDAEAIDILQTDATVMGGIQASIEVARIAADAGVTFAPHVWGCGPAVLSNAVALACSPSPLYLELPQVINPLRDATMREEALVEGGSLILSESPGLGSELPEDLTAWRFDPKARPVLKGERNSS